jgi:GTP-binding protein HflX
VPVAALVGYTNAGKTTLLNRLTGAGGTVQNQLFTTLDPLARRMRGALGKTLILTDTVGFLHHLPHHLIEAFKATLEEARDADVLLHVLDVSHPLASAHAEAVEEVLAQLELQHKPVITVLNKCDRVDDALRLRALTQAYAPAAAISAKTGQGIKQLEAVIDEQLGLLLSEPIRLQVPLERADVLASIYQSGQVLARTEVDQAMVIKARLPGRLQAVLAAYILP